MSINLRYRSRVDKRSVDPGWETTRQTLLEEGRSVVEQLGSERELPA
jgi:hypothetical protein